MKADLITWGLILALQAEIEGMKAANLKREMLNKSLAYNQQSFVDMADRIREIVYKHNSKLDEDEKSRPTC